MALDNYICYKINHRSKSCLDIQKVSARLVSGKEVDGRW